MSQRSVVLGRGVDRINFQLYKELEAINFKEQFARNLKSRERDSKSVTLKIYQPNAEGFFEFKGKEPKNQLELFQNSMRVLLICGQLIGLNPFLGVMAMDVSDIRFKYLSFRFLYSCLIFVCQAIATMLCIYRIFRNTISITIISFVSFYLSTTLTTLLFLRIAYKWPALMRNLVNSSLDKYIDAKIQPQLILRSVILLGLALLEHLLSTNTKLTEAWLCPKDNSTIYKDFTDSSFPWYTQLDLPFYVPTGIFLQLLNIITTMNWSYSDVFIVCMSYYLAALLMKIKQTIVDAEKKYYQPSYWSALREDYTRATRLVTSFDNAISGLMFLSFAANLFFICLQLFHVFSYVHHLYESILYEYYYQPSYWSALREDYTRATRLVTSFDNAISGLMFLSFAANLFFICLQLFHVFSHGLKQKAAILENCPGLRNGGILAGYEDLSYFIFSFVFVLCRFLAVSMKASSVHSASLTMAPALYNLPSTVYCSEIQRFLEQVHGSTVALSGLQFFYVTKGLILTVAGTIVTYELVLLQFNGEDNPLD